MFCAEFFLILSGAYCDICLKLAHNGCADYAVQQ